MRCDDGGIGEDQGIAAPGRHQKFLLSGLFFCEFCGILRIRRGGAIFAPGCAYCKGKRSAAQQPEHPAVDHGGQGAVDDDRPRDDEHFGRGARDEALCLCQDRDEGNFCPILLGFWLLKFLKKSAFFAKLL